MPVRGIRGATTAAANTREAVLEATRELLEEMVAANQLDADDVASAWFTTSPDLIAEFPAVAARQYLGWTTVPLMCSHDMSVPGSLAMCVRILLHVNTEKSPREIHHTYLRGATVLRRDIVDGAAGSPASPRS